MRATIRPASIRYRFIITESYWCGWMVVASGRSLAGLVREPSATFLGSAVTDYPSVAVLSVAVERSLGFRAPARSEGEGGYEPSPGHGRWCFRGVCHPSLSTGNGRIFDAVRAGYAYPWPGGCGNRCLPGETPSAQLYIMPIIGPSSESTPDTGSGRFVPGRRP